MGTVWAMFEEEQRQKDFFGPVLFAGIGLQVEKYEVGGKGQRQNLYGNSGCSDDLGARFVHI